MSEAEVDVEDEKEGQWRCFNEWVGLAVGGGLVVVVVLGRGSAPGDDGSLARLIRPDYGVGAGHSALPGSGLVGWFLATGQVGSTDTVTLSRWSLGV